MSKKEKYLDKTEVEKIILEYLNTERDSGFRERLKRGLGNALNMFIEDFIGDIPKDKAEKLFNKELLTGTPKWLRNVSKPVGIAIKGFNRIDDFQDNINIALEVGKSFQNQYPINTAIDELTFKSLDEWFVFYKDIKDARIQDLIGLSDEEKAIIEENYRYFDELMVNEFLRYIELTKSKEEADKKRKVDFSPSFILKQMTLQGAKETSYYALIKHREREGKINYDRDYLKNEIKKKQSGFLFAEKSIYNPVELSESNVSPQREYSKKVKQPVQNNKQAITPFIPQTDDISAENLQKIFDLQREIENKQKEEKRESLNSLLSEFQSYVDKYSEIEEKFNKKRAELEAARNPENSAQIDRSLVELEFQKTKALDAVNNEFAQREESFKVWTNQIANLSIDQLKNLLEEAEKELEKVESSGENGNKLAEARRKVQVLDEKIKDPSTTTSKQRSLQEWESLQKTLKGVSGSFTEIGKNVDGLAGKIISTAGEIATSTISMIDGIINLANGASTGTKVAANAAAASIQTVEKASVILAVISAALQIATKIASLFAADYSEYEKAKGAYKSYISVLDKVIAKQKELVGTLTGENARNSYKYALEAIKKQEESSREMGLIFAGSGGSIGSHSKGYRAWERISDKGWEQLWEWNGSYDANKRNAKNVDWLFGQTSEELAKLQEKAPLFWAQLGDDIGGYLQAIIDSGKAAEEMDKLYKESITKVSFDAFRDNFLSTLADMDSSAENFANDFEKYLQTAMLNALLKEKFDKEIKNLYNSFAKYGEDGGDGNIDEEEYAALQKQKDDLVNAMLSERDKLKEIFDWSSDANSAQASTGAGLASITQDSANRLNGSFDSMLRYTSAISDTTSQSLLVQQAMNSSLDTIAVNTSYLININATLEDIKIRGIKTKI